MSEHEKYVLQVTAGPSYDESTHSVVNVNTDQPVHISSDEIDANVRVRIQNYRGLPATAPPTSDYFTSPQHTADRYSIDFRFTPKKHSISGADMLFGNDFDRPLRDRLPPGFNTAFKFAKWWIDPGLEGDPYADQPYLYGPLLSSVNVLKVGAKQQKSEDDAAKKDSLDAARPSDPKPDEELVLEEGAYDEEAWEARSQFDMPDEAAARKKFYLDEGRKKEFEFEKGREYQCDFFNPYLDFNEFAVRLPGINIPILKHWDGNQALRDHTLRYVLKDRSTATTLLVVVLKLLPVAELTEPHNLSTDAGKQAHDASVNQRAGGGADASSTTFLKKSIRRPRFLRDRIWKGYAGKPVRVDGRATPPVSSPA